MADNAKTWFDKGNSFLSRGRYKEAVKCYDRVIKYEDAIECLDKSLGINPQGTNAWIMKGLAFSALGRRDEAVKSYEEALTSFNKAIEIDPTDGEA